MDNSAISVLKQGYGHAAASPAALRPGTRSAPAPASAPSDAAAEKAAVAAAEQQSMQRVAERANQALAQKSRELTFEFNEDVDRVVVKLIDKHTGEVLRQFPSEELIAIARALEGDGGAGALLRTDS